MGDPFRLPALPSGRVARFGYLGAFSPFLHESEKDLQWHGRLATAGMIKENSRNRATPVLQQGYQPALRNMRCNHRHREVGDAYPLESAAQHNINVIGDE